MAQNILLPSCTTYVHIVHIHVRVCMWNEVAYSAVLIINSKFQSTNIIQHFILCVKVNLSTSWSCKFAFLSLISSKIICTPINLFKTNFFSVNIWFLYLFKVLAWHFWLLWENGCSPSSGPVSPANLHWKWTQQRTDVSHQF